MTERRYLHFEPDLSLVGISVPIATLLRGGLVSHPNGELSKWLAKDTGFFFTMHLVFDKVNVM